MATLKTLEEANFENMEQNTILEMRDRLNTYCERFKSSNEDSNQTRILLALETIVAKLGEIPEPSTIIQQDSSEC
jgi:hypothetical protein